MLRISVLLLISALSIKCHGQKQFDLKGSIWVKEGELCYDTLKLIDGTNNFNEYFCDTGYNGKGMFTISGDTLILTSFETIEFIKETFGKTVDPTSNSNNLIPISIIKYNISSLNKLQKYYFKDLISGYKSEGRDWTYTKVVD